MSKTKDKNATSTKFSVVKSSPVFDGMDPTLTVLHEVKDLFRFCAESARAISEYRTERASIEANARVQIESIRSQREVIITFLEKTFEERHENFRNLFDRLDDALDNDNLEATKLVLCTLVHYAKSSPFDALRDAVSAHEALQDKSTIWEF
jgi:predicted RNase H-like nuclease (RuvC/YqgF family)